MIQILVIEEKDCKVIMVNILSKVKGELEKIDIKMEDFHKQLNLLKMKIKKKSPERKKKKKENDGRV